MTDIINDTLSKKFNIEVIRKIMMILDCYDEENNNV